MDIINFIIQRNADKFINDTREDLWKYRRFLETQKGEKAKRLLQSVNKQLGIKEDVCVPVKPSITKEEKLIRKESIKAIREHFDD